MAKLSTNMENLAESIDFKGKTLNLMNDIDLGSHEWTSIASKGYNGGWGAFEGTFDGQGHVIKNLYCHEAKDYQSGEGHGLFHAIRYGTVKNLGIEDADIYVPFKDSASQAGILVDWCIEGKIYNCYTTGQIISDEKYGTNGFGGIVGFSNFASEIAGCYSSATVKRNLPATGNEFECVGGIVGSWDNGSEQARISDCYFNGEIICNDNDSNIGGIIGKATTHSQKPALLIENCFVKPKAVNPDFPGQFCYIGSVDQDVTLKNGYYTEPDTFSVDEEAYSVAIRFNRKTGNVDLDYLPDVSHLSDMKDSVFLANLNRNASYAPPVTWIMGQEHPIFSWDLKQKPPVLSMTATASDAVKANVTAVSDQDGTLYYIINDRNAPAPSDIAELEQMADNQEGIAGGSCSVLAGRIVNLEITGLEELTEYTVYAAAKNENGIWSAIISADFKTTQPQLAGAVVISGFPVEGEELTAEVIGIQEDAEPVFTWYRDKAKIDGADSDTYLLSGDDIGHTLHAEVTSPAYAGILKSVSTPEIAEEYTVDKIKVIKKPDKMTYQTGEAFDKTGMEVKAYLKASASNATPSTAQKRLTESEYDVDYDFSKAGTAVVTISYMDKSTTLEVTVFDEALVGEIALTGRPIAGEKLSAAVSGAPSKAAFTYSWYRDKTRISGVSGASYLLTDQDIGHRIHAEASAAGYAGKLVSLPTDTIQKGYVVSGIKVTRLPDTMTYQRYGTFDAAGMEVTASFKTNIFDTDAAFSRVLGADEYEISYDFSRTGTIPVTVICNWNGAAYMDQIHVTVVQTDGSSSGGSGSTVGRRQSALAPQDGAWEQREDGTWIFKKANGTYPSNEWLYIRNNDRNEWFRFHENGGLVSGWFNDSNGNWYYLESNHNGSFGAMKTGWIFGEDGYWYYLNPSTGAMMTGWQMINGTWYYLNPTVYGQTWIPDQNETWKWSKSTLIPYGAMYADTVTPDGFRVGPDGARVE